MLRQLGIVVAAVAFSAAVLTMPATAREGTATTAVSSAASPDVSAQKVKRVRKPAVRRMAASAPYQQCFLFFCSSGRPYNLLVLGVAY